MRCGRAKEKPPMTGVAKVAWGAWMWLRIEDSGYFTGCDLNHKLVTKRSIIWPGVQDIELFYWVPTYLRKHNVAQSSQRKHKLAKSTNSIKIFTTVEIQGKSNNIGDLIHILA